MALKKAIKDSEARILVYLSQVLNVKKTIGMISAKLDMDYSYCAKILKRMIVKDWVFLHQYNAKTFYDVRKDAPVEDAKGVLMPEVIKEIIQAAEQQKLDAEKE